MGKTCGRGQKGQMSRKGHKHKLGFEGGQMRLIRRIPKRGFKNPAGVVFSVVNVGDLDGFKDGAEVAVGALREQGLVRGSASAVKVLGGGELSRRLVVKADAFSASAKAKIEKAGGVCETVRK
jgi:large subunit ribosomal protein L15